jgi:transposase
MSGFVEGIDRSQSSLFPADLEDYVAEDNLVRAVDAFVDGLDLGKLGFAPGLGIGRDDRAGSLSISVV